MTSGPIISQLIQFAVPMAIGLLFQQLYNTVDAIVVGRFVGKEALAAVGSTSSIVNMLVGFCAGLSTGASVVISQSYGAHDEEKLHDAVHTTMYVSFLICLVATGFGLLIIKPMLRLMNTPADVLENASLYLTIYFAGISGLLIYNMGSGILRAVGDSRRPLYFLCVSATVNVIFDLVFVIGFKMGVAGVAYATILAQFVSAVMVLFSLSREDVSYGVRWRELCIRKDTLRRIMSIGMPAGLQQAITSFSNVFVQSYINFFGSACMAGWASYNKLDVYLLVPVQSLAMASTTFVGQNAGAGNYARARDGVRKSILLSLVVTAALSALVVLLRNPLLTLFSTDAEVLSYGARFVLIISPFYVLICFNQILAGALRGVGEARVPMVIMLSSFVLFRQAYLFIGKQLGGGFLHAALAYPLGWVLCSVCMIYAYSRSAICRSGIPPVVETEAALPEER